MVDNKFVLNIKRMADEDLLEYLVGEVEAPTFSRGGIFPRG